MWIYRWAWWWWWWLLPLHSLSIIICHSELNRKAFEISMNVHIMVENLSGSDFCFYIYSHETMYVCPIVFLILNFVYVCPLIQSCLDVECICVQMKYITAILPKMNNYLNKSPDADHPIYHYPYIRTCDIGFLDASSLWEKHILYSCCFITTIFIVPVFSFFFFSMSVNSYEISLEQISRFCDQMNSKYWTLEKLYLLEEEKKTFQS